jgi:hypothetical protein
MLRHKIYSCFLIFFTLILVAKPELVRTETIKDTREATAKKLINAVNRSETSYFLEVSKFSNNFTDLQITLPDNSYIYRINILESYIGGIFYDNNLFKSIVCQSEEPTKDIVQSIALIDRTN